MIIDQIYTGHPKVIRRKAFILFILNVCSLAVLVSLTFIFFLFRPDFFFPIVIINLILTTVNMVFLMTGRYKITANFTPYQTLISTAVSILLNSANPAYLINISLSSLMALFFSDRVNMIIVSVLNLVGIPLLFILHHSPDYRPDTLFLTIIATSIFIVLTANLFSYTVQVDSDEKTSLISEIQHRVNNNLQIVSGLLQMETKDISDPHAQERIKHIRGLIGSISTVQKNIYRDLNYHIVNFSQILKQLTEMHDPAGRHFRLKPGQTVSLRIETAVPLSMVLYDILGLIARNNPGTNLTLELSKTRNHVTLSADTPESLPSENLLTEKNLTTMLLQQINAVMTVDTAGGCHLRIEFEDMTDTMKFR